MKTVAMSRSRRKRAMPILMPDGHVVAKFLCVLCCVVCCVCLLPKCGLAPASRCACGAAGGISAQAGGV